MSDELLQRVDDAIRGGAVNRELLSALAAEVRELREQRDALNTSNMAHAVAAGQLRGLLREAGDALEHQAEVTKLRPSVETIRTRIRVAVREYEKDWRRAPR